MSENYDIVCASCDVALNGPTNPSVTDMISCPQCGTADTYANVIDEAKAYATERAARRLQNTVRDVAAKSKFMTYKLEHIPARTYRFIVKDFL